MTTRAQARLARVVTGLMFLFPMGFLVAMPWLKTQPATTTFLVGGIAAAGTVITGFVFSVLKDRELDEWHRGAARFANQWGWLAGSSVVALLLSIPAFQRVIIEASSTLAESAGTADQQALFAFVLGFMAVVIAQQICILALNKSWRIWMSRATT